MKTGTLELQISVKFKWWVNPYISTLKLFCLTLGIEPNYDKVGEFIGKYGLIMGVRVKFKEKMQQQQKSRQGTRRQSLE